MHVAGESWTGYRQCRNDSGPLSSCLEDLQKACHLAKHRVTKVVRLTVDTLEYVLETNPKVKVIHLFRDPRAIINSRVMTDWYYLKETPQTGYSDIRANAQFMCDRMLYDFREGLKLKRKFPDRFAFVFFEDIMENLKPKAKMLYSYCGINPELLETALENIHIPLEGVALVNNKSKREFSSWWRSRMDINVIRVVDSVCSKVYEPLGYIKLIDPGELRNSSIQSYNIKEEFRIDTIHRNVPYSFSQSAL